MQLKRIKDWFNAKKLKKAARAAMKANQKPRIYKVWEHQGWGDRISVRRVNKDGSFEIDGHLMTRPSVGDFIIYDVAGGKKGKDVVSRVEYCRDPWDMFFATVIPVCYYEEESK